MTQPVNANAAPLSSRETDVSVPSASQSSTSSPPSPSPSPAGLSPVELLFSFSQGGGGTELCCFKLWLYNSAFQTKSFTAMSCLKWLNPLEPCPWKIQQELLEINHMTRRKQSLDFVSCIAVGYTCNSADRCIFFNFFFLNHCFHLKSLHLAPNCCWRYTMGYLNSFYAHTK